MLSTAQSSPQPLCNQWPGDSIPVLTAPQETWEINQSAALRDKPKLKSREDWPIIILVIDCSYKVEMLVSTTVVHLKRPKQVQAVAALELGRAHWSNVETSRPYLHANQVKRKSRAHVSGGRETELPESPGCLCFFY